MQSMAKKLSSHKDSGPEAFDSWYATMYPERWLGLRTACLTIPRHFQLTAGLQKPYFLDPASVVAALYLGVEPGLRVLDLCAAPGGKSLILALKLFGLVSPSVTISDLGKLVDASENQQQEAPPGVYREDTTANGPSSDPVLCLNERSATRRARLHRVVEQHLPASVRSGIRISGHDAALWGQHEQNAWDRILLDIPCSSERHLLNNVHYLKDWSPKRSSQLAQQAYAMGLSAALALKMEGQMLYSTCALSNQENDGVIERLLERSQKQSKRYGFHLEIDTDKNDIKWHSSPVPPPIPTHFGWCVWPDSHEGFGPIYFSRLKKIGKVTY